MIPTETLDRWLLAIVAGNTERPAGLTGRDREVFDRLVVEVAEIEARGGVVDVPGEIPDATDDRHYQD